MAQLIALDLVIRLGQNRLMRTIPISEFKAGCIAILRQAQDSGEPLLVTRRGRPIARIEPVTDGKSQRQLGVFKGRMRLTGDLVQASSQDDWEMLE